MTEGVRVGTNHVTDTDALGLNMNSGVRVFRCESAHLGGPNQGTRLQGGLDTYVGRVHVDVEAVRGRSGRRNLGSKSVGLHRGVAQHLQSHKGLRLIGFHATAEKNKRCSSIPGSAKSGRRTQEFLQQP